MENEKPTGISGGLSELFEILQDLTNGADNFDVHIPPAGETDPNQSHSPPINIQPQPENDLGGGSTAGASKTTTTGAVSKKNPKIVVEVQPDGKIRFRYSCEGRSAGSIPGVNSTPDNRTYPTIEIVGWKGEIKLLVSLVTKDAPYRAHPHHLVGKDEHFEKGIFKKTLRAGSHREVFKFLGIQCVKRKEIKEALDLREAQQVDPFKQGFAHKDQPASIDLNAVRLCFQAYLVLPGGGVKSLKPVVSEPIYDKKSINELNICNICCCSGKVTGGDQIILLCEKVAKDDIKVRFFEVNEHGDELWEGFGEFTANDIHKQTAIVFRTPRYKHDEVDERSKFYIQLVRPSDGATSACREFEYYPNPGMRTFSRIRRKLKRKQDLEIFQQILSMDSETTATKYSCPPSSDPELETDDQDDDEEEHSCSTESSKSNPLSSDTLHDEEEVAAVKQQQSDSETNDLRGHHSHNHRDDDDDEEVDYISEKGLRGDMEIALEVPLINYPAADEATQTSTPMEEILKQTQLDIGPRQLSANDKITEWMRSSEFERFDSLTVENGDNDGDEDGDNDDISPMTAYTNITITTNNYNNNNNTTISTTTDDDKSLIDILEHVAEIDELPTEAQSEKLRRSAYEKEKAPNAAAIPSANTEDESKEIEDLFAAGTASTQASVEIDENFDDTSTYTSLQIAYRNPIDIPLHVLRDHPIPPHTLGATNENDDEYLVVLTNPPAPKIKVNAAQTPPSPTTPTLRLPPRTPSPVPDQMLPPLPPKPQSRMMQEQQNNSVATLQRYSDPGPAGLERPRRDSAGSSSQRPQSQIIIMRTPDQSPTKRPLQNTPTPTASPKKKQGFFSRLFSRRKSKSDLNCPEEQQATSEAPSQMSVNQSASLIGSGGKGNSMATTPTASREPSIGHFSLSDANRASLRSNKSGAQLQPPPSSPHNSSSSILRGGSPGGKPVGRSSSSVSGKRPPLLAYKDADVIHIPLKDESSGGAYSSASTITLGQHLDRKTLSALQLAEIPIFDGNMELVAIADRQSIKNLCEGAYGVQLDPSVDLSEAEHFALYTSMPPQCNQTGGGDSSDNAAEHNEHMLNYYQQVDAGHILTAEEVARRLAEANGLQ